MWCVPVVVWLLCCGWAHAHALGTAEGMTPEELALGLRGILAEPFAARGTPGPYAQVVDTELYQMAGLRRAYARVGFAWSRVGCGVEVSQIAAGIGAETGAALRVIAGPLLDWRIETVVARAQLRLDGLAAAQQTTVTLRSCGAVSRRVRVGYALERLRLSGEAWPGVDATAVVTVLPAEQTAINLALVIGRWGEQSVNLSATVGVVPGLRLSFGFDEGTGAVAAAVSIRRGALRLSAGQSVHRVLGAVQSVALSWGA